MLRANKLQEMPQDYAAEAACLGAMILAGDREIEEIRILSEIFETVNEDDFYRFQTRLLFRIIKELWSEGNPYDSVAIRNRYDLYAKDDKVFEDEDEFLRYLCKILDSVPSCASGVYYAKLVREKSVERQLIQAVETMREEVIDSSMPLKEKFISVGKLLHTEELLQKDEDIQMANLIDEYYLRSNTAKGLPTGFNGVDRHISLKRGRFNLVGGPPGMGKSSFILDMFIHHLRLGAKPYMISLEMYPDEIVERMIRNIGRVQSGFDKDDPDVMAAMKLIATWDGSICQKRDTNINEICSNVLAKRKKDNIGIAYIDHLHLINGQGKSLYEQITYISNALKSLAMKAEIPLVVAAQLNRAPNQRNNKRPKMSDLRGAGALEQDSDVILLLYSEDYYRQQEQANPQLDGEAECIINKNRNGSTGTAKLIWLPQYSSFSDMTPSFVNDDSLPF